MRVPKLVPGAEPWASIIEKVFSRFGRATKKIAEQKSSIYWYHYFIRKTAQSAYMKPIKYLEFMPKYPQQIYNANR